MAVLTGAVLFKSPVQDVNYENDAFGKNSEVFASGDLVQLSSGLLNVGTVTIVGVVAKTATMTSNNATVAKVQPLYQPIGQNDIFLMGTNSDLTGNGTDAGTYYSVTGATGAQKVDVTKGAVTGALRTVEIVEVDPRNIGGTGSGSGLREVLVRILKTPYQNVNITA